MRRSLSAVLDYVLRNSEFYARAGIRVSKSPAVAIWTHCHLSADAQTLIALLCQYCNEAIVLQAKAMDSMFPSSRDTIVRAHSPVDAYQTTTLQWLTNNTPQGGYRASRRQIRHPQRRPVKSVERIARWPSPRS